MRRIQLVLVIISFVGYGLYALIALGLRALGGPVLPMPHDRHAEAAEQRSLHGDIDRLDAIDACLFDSAHVYDAAIEVRTSLQDERPRISLRAGRPTHCTGLGVQGGRAAWSEVGAAGNRLDGAAQASIASMRRLEQITAWGNEADLQAAVARFDVTSAELGSAYDGLSNVRDLHERDFYLRVADYVADDPQRAHTIPVLHVIDASIALMLELRNAPADTTDLALLDVRTTALRVALAEVEDQTWFVALHARGNEALAALEAVKTAPPGDARELAIGAALDACRALRVATNGLTPGV